MIFGYSKQTIFGRDGERGWRELEPSGCRPRDRGTYVPMACGKQQSSASMQICTGSFHQSLSNP